MTESAFFATNAPVLQNTVSALFQPVEHIVLFQRYIPQVTLSNLQKNSVSNSIICFATDLDTNDEVALKVFWKYADDSNAVETDMLKFEGQVYHDLANNLKIPNVAQAIGSYVVSPEILNHQTYPDGFRRYLQLHKSEQSFKQFFLQLRANVGSAPVDAVYFVVTKKYKLTLRELIMEKPSLSILKSILFQVLYTVAALENAGLQHNDLHLSNIFLELRVDIPSITYKVQDMEFVVDCPYFARLYDWNYSTRGPLTNSSLDTTTCPKYGICNNINSRFDVYTFLQFLEDYIVPSEVRKFINICTKRQFETIIHRMCYLQNETCVPFEADMPENVMTATKALQQDFFKSLRKPTKQTNSVLGSVRSFFK
jgi:hypothetical protein